MAVSSLALLLLVFVVTVPASWSETTQRRTASSRLHPYTNSDLNRQSTPQPIGDRFVDFDWELSKALNEESQDNLVISPISLKIVLAMLYDGATGQTATEIQQALDFGGQAPTLRSKSRERFSSILKSLEKPDGINKIKIGTHVFIDKNTNVKEEFKDNLKENYNSALAKVDFSNTTAAVNIINTWASNATEGHIQQFISEAEADSNTIMLLLNAVYFKGLWKQPFPENQTKPGVFHANNTLTVNNVPFMQTTDKFDYTSISELKTTMIRLPYLGDKFAMYILLPDENEGLDALIQKLGPSQPISNYIKAMKPTPVNLILPKFDFHYTSSLRTALEKLNIKRMFTSEAELSNIAESTYGGKQLIVSNVLQKAGISVTENGTIAYAATVVELQDKFGGGEETIEFNANRPFLFFIKDEAVNTTLFVGRVSQPMAIPVPVIEDKLGGGGSDSDTNVIASTTGATNDHSPEALFDQDQEAIQAKFNYFDADLLKQLSDKEPGNFVMSTASIKTLLALILEGAEGSTQAEVLRVLRLPMDMTYARKILSNLQNTLHQDMQKTNQATIDSVAQVFVANTLRSNTTYVKSLRDHYKADVSSQDFTSPAVAANNINSWIRTRTKALISDLISEDMIKPQTYAILTSAIYFDGKWKEAFTPSKGVECFYTEPNAQCQLTPVMTKNEEVLYKLDQYIDSHVLQIPYEGDRFSMVIVMPRKKDGMRQLSVDAARLAFPRLLEKMNLFEVNLKMPAFSMEYGAELIDVLEKLDMTEVFSDSAKLPYMIDGTQGRVGAIVHKAKIEVTEKGTRAAAASAAAVVPLMFGLPTIDLTVNHPFYFFIYDQESKAVLFSGRLSSVGGGVPPAAVASSRPSVEALDSNAAPKYSQSAPRVPLPPTSKHTSPSYMNSAPTRQQMINNHGPYNHGYNNPQQNYYFI